MLYSYIEYKPVSYDENEELLFCAQTDPVNKYIQDSFMTFSSNKDDDKLCEELHKFRNRHYGAHRMTIAIQVTQYKLHCKSLTTY